MHYLKSIYFFIFFVKIRLRGDRGMKTMWERNWRDCEEELDGGDVLNDVVNIIGVFLVSALWVVYLSYLFGPILP